MRKLNVVICGGGDTEAWLHWRAYRGVDEAAVAGVCGTDAEERAAVWGCRAYPSLDAALADTAVDALELLDPLPNRTEAAEDALRAGKHVLMGAPFARASGSALRLAEAARKYHALLMPYDHWLFYPPVKKMLRVIGKKAVGRVTSMRRRALIAGLGGWDAYLNPEFHETQRPPAPAANTADVFTEIYHTLAVADRIFGPVAEIHNYSPNQAMAPGATVVTWKHAAHATYGAMDIILAPDMNVRSAYDPRDDNIEITGSAGIIWLTRAASQLRHEPTLRLYRGENQFAYGNLEDDWLAAFHHCVRHFAQCALHSRAPERAAADAARVVAATEAAARSADTGQRIILPDAEKNK